MSNQMYGTSCILLGLLLFISGFPLRSLKHGTILGIVIWHGGSVIWPLAYIVMTSTYVILFKGDGIQLFNVPEFFTGWIHHFVLWFVIIFAIPPWFIMCFRVPSITHYFFWSLLCDSWFVCGVCYMMCDRFWNSYVIHNLCWILQCD